MRKRIRDGGEGGSGLTHAGFKTSKSMSDIFFFILNDLWMFYTVPSVLEMERHFLDKSHHFVYR